MIIQDLDFNTLKNKICEEDLTLFDEIIITIENQAYRSASIIIWISILESLVRKLTNLSSNDNEIFEIMKKFENEKLSEKNLLEKCKDFKLINQIEYEQLETIRQARNNYAHHTFDSPTKEDVLIYLYYAIEYVLSKPILFSKNSAKNELNMLLNDSNYLGNANDEQVYEYALTFTKKIPKVYFDEIIKILFKIIERKYCEKDVNNQTCIKHGLIYSESLLTNNTEYMTSKNLNYLIDNYKITSCYLFSNPNIWNYLNSRSKERIFNYSKNNEFKQISNIDFINIFYKLYDSSKLDDSLIENYEQSINQMDLENLLHCNIPANLYYDKLIEEFKSYNYYRQNPAAKIIKLKDLSVFNENQLEQLGRNILQSAEGGSNDSEIAIKKFEKNGNLPKSFLKGLLFETLINDENKLRKKFRFFKHVINIINKSDNGEELFNEFLNNIKKAEPKDLDFFNYSTTIRKLKKIKLANNQLKLLLDALNISININTNNYIEKIFNLHYPKEFIPQLYNCLTDKNREKFIKLANENPVKFIQFFSIIEKTETFDYNIKKIDFKSLNKYISNEKLILEIKKLNTEELSTLDKQIIETFINNEKINDIR